MSNNRIDEASPKLLRVEDCARRLQISRSAVYVLLRGDLVSITIGRSRRVPVDALDRFIAERTAASE